MCFMPADKREQAAFCELLERTVIAEGQQVLGWRDVPVDEHAIGATARASRPAIRQLFIGAGAAHAEDQDAFERKLYVIRRVVEAAQGPGCYVASLSSRTLVYKGMLISYQLAGFYADLADERIASAMALVHSRFSTNTFPSWELAHPYRMIAHNGEINTLRGNVNWMAAREKHAGLRGCSATTSRRSCPIVRSGWGRTRRRFDNVLELLNARRALATARDHDDDPRGVHEPRRRAATVSSAALLRSTTPGLMEPWDGPAAVAFTDGSRRRRDARSQRAASRALAAHQGRPRHSGLGSRHPGPVPP